MLSKYENILKETFGHSSFRDGQGEIIASILAGNDTLGVLPTGGGKSLCYQLPALIMKGITIVVSPLIALMTDQVKALQNLDISSTYINSTLSPKELNDRLCKLELGEYKLVYVAPERFTSPRFMHAITANPIALFAVDEAHCISMWGHDFRPDYKKLDKVLAKLKQPQVLALTATATQNVRNDIIQQLGLGCNNRQLPQKVISGFSRPNLTLSVKNVSGQDEKLSEIIKIIKNHSTAIIYCSTRKNVDKVSGFLTDRKIKLISYHAGKTAAQRKKSQAKFMQKKVNIAVATNAFGMGIDRSDIRAIIHWNIPGSLESYYQEAGRAGRDNKPAHCTLLFNYADVKTHEFFIEGANPSEQIIKEVYLKLVQRCNTKTTTTVSAATLCKNLATTNNTIAVETSLNILIQNEFIAQSPFSSKSNKRVINILSKQFNLSSLHHKLEEKWRHDQNRLSLIINYAQNNSQCRHQAILNHFGDTKTIFNCKECDNCDKNLEFLKTTAPSSIKTARPPTEDELIYLQKILSCVARLDGKLEKKTIAQILKGSKSKTILQMGWNKTSTYALLKNKTATYIKAIINELIINGCLAIENVHQPLVDSTQKAVALTKKGRLVMRKQLSIRLIWPLEK